MREADGADARRCRGDDASRRARRRARSTALGYGYLRNPALQYAKALIAEGAIGEVFDFRGSVDEDYMADPICPGHGG